MIFFGYNVREKSKKADALDMKLLFIVTGQTAHVPDRLNNALVRAHSIVSLGKHFPMYCYMLDASRRVTRAKPRGKLLFYSGYGVLGDAPATPTPFFNLSDTPSRLRNSVLSCVRSMFGHSDNRTVKYFDESEGFNEHGMLEFISGAKELRITDLFEPPVALMAPYTTPKKAAWPIIFTALGQVIDPTAVTNWCDPSFPTMSPALMEKYIDRLEQSLTATDANIGLKSKPGEPTLPSAGALAWENFFVPLIHESIQTLFEIPFSPEMLGNMYFSGKPFDEIMDVLETTAGTLI